VSPNNVIRCTRVYVPVVVDVVGVAERVVIIGLEGVIKAMIALNSNMANFTTDLTLAEVRASLLTSVVAALAASLSSLGLVRWSALAASVAALTTLTAAAITIAALSALVAIVVTPSTTRRHVGGHVPNLIRLVLLLKMRFERHELGIEL
jgi:hypothetical protein